MDRTELSVETEDSFSSLLEYAANDDVASFQSYIEHDFSAVDETGLWYVRKEGSKLISYEERTPLMIAATYGSVDVLKFIVALPEVDLNRTCGKVKWTALHCAAYGGSLNAVDIVKLLLYAGADPSIEDTCGRCPVDVIVVHPKLPRARALLEDLLMNNVSDGSVGAFNLPISICNSNASSPVLSSTRQSVSPTSPSDVPANFVSEKKQYPIDPSLPDIRNSIYSTNEFRMFSFKVRPCSRAYSHDWTECPFVHPGENARRRDPRKFHYSCVPCADFRKGACRRGDLCENAHGVFECWLHPAQYRTRLCKDGTSCARQVCFFAHTQDELRPLYGSSGSGVSSPRSAGFMDMVAALNLFPGSPPLSHSPAPWPQPNVPALHLPGSNMQSSRLRSSLSARDITPDDLNMLNLPGWSKTSLTPSNLEDLFLSEMASSPRLSERSAVSGVFSPRHKPAVLNQFHHQQNMLSPINTNLFSPRNVEHPLFQASSPRMSPRSLESASPMSARFTALAHRENLVAAAGSPVASWSDWGSPSGKIDWLVSGEERVSLKRSTSFELNDDGERPDFSWVQSLVKESPPEKTGMRPAALECESGEFSKSNSQVELIDHSALGGWIEQMQQDQVVVL